MAPGIIHHEYYKKIIPLAIFLGIFETIIIGIMFYKYINPILFFLFYCINYGLGYIIDPDADQYTLTISEGVILRQTKKFHIGFLGVCHVAYWFIYAYIVGFFNGHRSWLSHGWIIGTLFRIIYFNTPFFVSLILFCNCAVMNWNWHIKNLNDFSYFLYMDYWLIPYLLSQFTAWFISDGMHLILDTEWAKNKLYIPVTHHKDEEN